MQTIKRDIIYLQRLINRKENSTIKIVTGLRRCGKSYLLFKLYYNYLLSIGVQKDHIITLSLDEDENRQYRNIDNLSAFLTSKIFNDYEMFYILLDEAQFAIGDDEFKRKTNEPIRLYGLLNGLMRRNNVDIYITGSNSKFLSTDVMTEFRGRGDEVRIFPLKFSEFLSAYPGDKDDALSEYFTYGGLPMILSKKTDEEKSQYLSDLLQNVYIKDIAERYDLRGNIVINDLINVLASYIGSLTNPVKIANTFLSNGIKTNPNTVSNYIDCLTDAFLINKAKRYDIKGKKYIGSPFKYYFTDIGLRNAKLNFAQQEQSHIMENVVYNELIVRGYNVDVGIICKGDNTAGKHTITKYEVDFACNLGNKRYYIQSALSIPDRDKMIQEQTSLDQINDSFKKIIIINQRFKPWHNEKGYLIISLLDFLLHPDSLDA